MLFSFSEFHILSSDSETSFGILYKPRLLAVPRAHLVSGEVESLEPIVASEGALLDVGDVVVGEVQLHQDFEVLERIAVYLLQKNMKIQDSVQVRFLGWAVLKMIYETLELSLC